jgi:phosphoenolpyruvate carboxylase
MNRVATQDRLVSEDKDLPLKEDVRLLGRILGDTVREQEGEETYAIVERIRQASIRFHRDGDAGARRELEATLDSLNADQTLTIVRAFSYFSHLANIAEDQHHTRRNRAHVRAGSHARPGSLDHALERARAAGHDDDALRAFFDHALASPVLTAHPTEVRRKSTPASACTATPKRSPTTKPSFAAPCSRSGAPTCSGRRSCA